MIFYFYLFHNKHITITNINKLKQTQPHKMTQNNQHLQHIYMVEHEFHIDPNTTEYMTEITGYFPTYDVASQTIIRLFQNSMERKRIYHYTEYRRHGFPDVYRLYKIPMNVVFRNNEHNMLCGHDSAIINTEIMSDFSAIMLPLLQRMTTVSLSPPTTTTPTSVVVENINQMLRARDQFVGGGGDGITAIPTSRTPRMVARKVSF